MSKIRFVVFDVDGTLIDSQYLIIRAMQEACKKLGLVCPTERERLLSGVGLPLKQALQCILPDLDDAMLDKLTEAYRAAHFELGQSHEDLEPLFPGIMDMLDKLQGDGYTLGIFTSKMARGLERMMVRNDMRGYFKSVKTPDLGPGKPDPFLLNQAMQELEFQPQETIFIGDSTYDMIAGRAAGTHCLGIAWGYHTVPQLVDAGAHKIAERVDEIPPFIGSWKAA